MKASAVVALAVAALLAGGAPTGAEHPPDEDGVVPIFVACDPEGVWTSTHIPTEQANGDGPYRFSVIVLNECYMEELGYGPVEVMASIEHERAHSRGWDHCEGTPEENAAFWPYVDRAGVGC